MCIIYRAEQIETEKDKRPAESYILIEEIILLSLHLPSKYFQSLRPIVISQQNVDP